MEAEGNTALSKAAQPSGFDVAIVDPEVRHRTKLVMQLAGVTAAGAFESADAFGAQLASGRPTVALFGPELANEDGLAQVRRLASTHPEVGVVLVAERLSTALLQQALRAGVRDAITMAEGETPLRSSVERVGALLVAQRPRALAEAAFPPGRVVVSFSTKGGVGKSVVATNLAVAMARRSPRPVAIIDADLQFGDVAVLLGVSPERTVVDAAAAIHHDDPELMSTLVMRHEPSGLLVLPAPVEPSAADQVRPEEMLLIIDALRKICGWVIIDMPPHFDDFVLALLEAADDVLLVASMDIPSIKNLKVGMQTLDLLSLAGSKLKLVLNRANARVKLDIKEVERALGLPADFPVPSDIAVPQAVNRGVPVVLDNPKSQAARALEEIASTMMGLEHEPEVANRRRRWSRDKAPTEGET
jgi:pilus assembly protein CpaE